MSKKSRSITTLTSRGYSSPEIIRFEFTETSGQIITDSVTGVSQDFSADNRLSYGGPAHSVVVGAGGIQAYTNASLLPVLTSGIFLMYGCANFKVQNSLCSISDLVSTNPAHPYTPNFGFEGLNATQTGWWVGNSSTQYTQKTLAAGDCFHNILGLVGYVMIIPVGVSNATASLYLHNGSVYSITNVSTVQFGGGWSGYLAAIDLPTALIGLRNLDAYVLGCACFAHDTPTAAECAAAAVWHHTNAPLGTKTLYPGFAAYF